MQQPSPSGPPTRRNILLITTDQERRFDADPVPLPTHERLRSAGTSYERFYGASMACSSARSVMYTGQHAVNTGVTENIGVPGQQSMTTDLPTLGTMLGDLGYLTAYKGKWHLSTEALPSMEGLRVGSDSDGPLSDALLPYGFADYNDGGDDLGGVYEGYNGDGQIADSSVEWLRTSGAAANEAGQPWCLAVNFVNPHDIMFGTSDPDMLAGKGHLPLNWPTFTGPPEHELYEPIWDLPDDPSWTDSLNAAGRPGAHRDFAIANRLFTGIPATSQAQVRLFRNYYLNCLRDVDRWVGRLLDGLAASGLADDTVIVYTSDHGELAGAHGLFGKGPCAYDENLRVPFIVVDPAAPGGGQSDVIASQLDLVPTLVGLASGSPGPDSLPGRDLARDDRRAAALFAYDGLVFLDGDWARRTGIGRRAADQVTGRDLTRRGLMRTIITDSHKFSRYFAPGDHHRPSSMEELLARNDLELFDLQADPSERTNLAHDADRAAMERIEGLDRMLSNLIDAEIGEDDGASLPQFEGAPWASTEPG